MYVCVHRSTLPCQLLSAFLEVPGGLSGFPGWSWLGWHLEDWSVMACRVVLCSSSHSYCPSVLRSPLSLCFLVLCLSGFSLQLSHLSLSVTLLYVFFLLSVLCTHLVPSLSHFHFLSPLPGFFFSPLSLAPSIIFLSIAYKRSITLTFSLTHTPFFLFSHLSAALLPLLSLSSISRSVSVSGVTVLGRPPRGARLPPLLHVGRRGGEGARPLHQPGWPSLKVQRAVRGQGEQPEVKRWRRTYNTAMMKGDIYTAGGLI